MNRISLILLFLFFFCAGSSAQYLSSRYDSIAWSSSRALQIQLQCTDSQLNLMYMAGKARMHDIDSIGQLSIPLDMRASSLQIVNRTYLKKLKNILLPAQWELFKVNEKKRHDAAADRLRKRGIIINELANEELD